MSYRKVWFAWSLLALVFGTPLPKVSNESLKVQFTDITEKAGIKFTHVSSPEKKYIVESMSGGVALFDYDNDGYLDIYLVNSLTVDLVKSKQKTRSALYHNNGDGTFTDVTTRPASVTSAGAWE